MILEISYFTVSQVPFIHSINGVLIHVSEDCEIFVQFSPIHSKKGVLVQSLEGNNATGELGDSGEKLDTGNKGDSDEIGGARIGGDEEEDNDKGDRGGRVDGDKCDGGRGDGDGGGGGDSDEGGGGDGDEGGGGGDGDKGNGGGGEDVPF